MSVPAPASASASVQPKVVGVSDPKKKVSILRKLSYDLPDHNDERKLHNMHRNDSVIYSVFPSFQSVRSKEKKLREVILRIKGKGRPKGKNSDNKFIERMSDGRAPSSKIQHRSSLCPMFGLRQMQKLPLFT